VAIFPLELMSYKLLSVCKLFFLPCAGHCLPSGSSFCCNVFYCPRGILGTGICSLDISAREHLGLEPSPALQKSVGHFFCSAFAFVMGE